MSKYAEDKTVQGVEVVEAAGIEPAAGSLQVAEALKNSSSEVMRSSCGRAERRRAALARDQQRSRERRARAKARTRRSQLTGKNPERWVDQVLAELRERGSEGEPWTGPALTRYSLMPDVDVIREAAEALPTHACGVYIIRCRSGRLKIGKSSDLRSRLRGHAKKLCGEGAALPGPVELVHILHCNRAALLFVESALHCIYGRGRIGTSEIFAPVRDTPKPESLGSAGEVVAMAVSAVL